MKFIVSIGTNLFICTTGLITCTDENRNAKDLFRIRQIYVARSESSYLAIDCDIKDQPGKREVRICKNNLVDSDPDVQINSTRNSIEVMRNDGNLVIKVIQVDKAVFLEKLDYYIKRNIPDYIDAAFVITGSFFVDGHMLKTTEGGIIINNCRLLRGNISIGTGGMRLSPYGFAM